MAAKSRASKPGRQLGELLQEQQEPFVLEVYLSERGCCHGNSGKFLNKSASQNGSKKGFPQFIRKQFFKMRTRISDDEDGKLSVTEIGINNGETAEADRFSSASSATMYNSCSDSDIDEPPMFADTSMSNRKLYDEREKKAAADTKLEWSCMEHSPQSVLEEVSTSTSSPLDTPKVSRKRIFSPKLIKVDSILSPWLLNLLQTRPDKSSCVGLKLHKVLDWCSSSRWSRSKSVSHQRKQLLLDCIRELVENKCDKEQKGKGKEFKGSAEVIRRVRFENIKEWGKRCGHESNMKQLLETDIIDSIQWRNEFESQKWNIGMVVGNAIVEEITSEVVMDIMNAL
ncbi:hypothetical protein HRI_002776400 [Hibiscus trionum]|uniref:DUF4378 domain-containing protein n=1 Tax=Hibiscus trionum TaxID=183268 RepID=A0A9W7M878_HIBTR|nr:hypothetical protein HRI_002776400 [Hibiscus trionum]